MSSSIVCRSDGTTRTVIRYPHGLRIVRVSTNEGRQWKHFAIVRREYVLARIRELRAGGLSWRSISLMDCLPPLGFHQPTEQGCGGRYASVPKRLRHRRFLVWEQTGGYR